MTEDNGIAGAGIKLGITLYSLTSELARSLYSARDPHQGSGQSRAPPGRRVQHRADATGLPDVDDEFVKIWRDSSEKIGTSSSPARSAPTSLVRDHRQRRRMDEEHDFLARQLKTAHTLSLQESSSGVPRRGLLRSLLPLAGADQNSATRSRHAPSGPKASPGQNAGMLRRAAAVPSGSGSPPTSRRRCTRSRRRCCAAGMQQEALPVMEQTGASNSPHVRNQKFDYLWGGCRPSALRPLHELASAVRALAVRPEDDSTSCTDVPRARQVLRHRARKADEPTMEPSTAWSGSSSRAATRGTSPASAEGHTFWASPNQSSTSTRLIRRAMDPSRTRRCLRSPNCTPSSRACVGRSSPSALSRSAPRTAAGQEPVPNRYMHNAFQDEQISPCG